MGKELVIKQIRKTITKHSSKHMAAINNRADFTKTLPKIGKLVQQSPHFAGMFLTDPIKALEFIGYNFSTEMKHDLHKSMPSLFGSWKSFHRALHSTRGLPWIKSVRIVIKPGTKQARRHKLKVKRGKKR